MLRGLIYAPTLRADGSIFSQPGYDPATGLLLLDCGISWESIPDKPDKQEALDAAASEGPQLIHRRKQTFVVTTEEEIERRLTEACEGKRKKFISAWDALRPSFDQRIDVDFPRIRSKPRVVKF